MYRKMIHDKSWNGICNIQRPTTYRARSVLRFIMIAHRIYTVINHNPN